MPTVKKVPKPIPIGKQVTWTRNNGKPGSGRVAGRDLKSNGPWVAVNQAPKGTNPDMVNVQQSRLTVVVAG